MSILAARSLIIGLVAGVFLAVLLQQPLLAQLPREQHSVGATDSSFEAGSTPPLLDMLRNSLQIARRAVCGGAVGAGYKSRPDSVLKSIASLSSLPSSSPTTTTTTTTSKRSIHSTPAAMASTKPFLQAVKDRRTIYALNKKAPISDKEIVEIVKTAVLHVPSSFNSQSARLVVLLNEEHDKFWDSTLEILKTIVPADQLPSTEGRINGFKGGYGSILFFEDPAPVSALQKAFPLYSHHFPDWSEHTSAMHQYALWVALEAEGFGANLQHYNPIVDQKVQQTWNVPLEWKLRAQLVFGGREAEAGEKEFGKVEGERLFVYGAKE